MLCAERSHRLRIAVAQLLRPDIPARAGKRILDGHEDAILDRLRTKLCEKRLDITDLLLEMREGKLQCLVLTAVELSIVDAFNAVDRHACLLPYIRRLLQPAMEVAERHITIMRKPDGRRVLRIRYICAFFGFICRRLLLCPRCVLGARKRRIVDRITEVKRLRICELLSAQQSLLDQQVEVHEIRIPREGGKCLVR